MGHTGVSGAGAVGGDAERDPAVHLWPGAADRPVARGTRRGAGLGRRREAPDQDARRPALALALCARRLRFRRHAQCRPRSARAAGWRVHHRPSGNHRGAGVHRRHLQMANAFSLPWRRTPGGG